MNIKRPEMLVIIISLIVCLICACLVRLTNIMSIPASLGLFVASFTYSILAIKKYKHYKDEIAEMRYQDAYLYADEQDNIDEIVKFKYSKKTEKFLRMQKFQKWLNMITPIIICVISLILIIAGFKVVLNA